jgi:hypothetical protein
MACSAIVARVRPNGLEYLVRRHEGFDWALAEEQADRFLTVREATRAALRLPSRFRAFAMPVEGSLRPAGFA